MPSLFLRETDFYQRNINPIREYLEQNSFYLSKMTGKDRNVCKDLISNNLKNFPGIKDPAVKFFYRPNFEDRQKEIVPLTKYIKAIEHNKQILAPSFTSYVNEDVKPSLLVGFADGNATRRSIAKKKAQKLQAEGNPLYLQEDNTQANMKNYNNSLSGAFVAGGSVVNNPTAHSTLTTVTRTVSSLGNASNEKVITGNRHYRNADIILNNLISITSSVSVEALEPIMEKYHLHYPTADEVLDVIYYSSDLYFKDEKAFVKIKEFIATLNKYERAGFVYFGDLYHIRVYNEEFVRTFITNISSKRSGEFTDPISYLQGKEGEEIDEQLINYVHQVCMTECKGIGKDYSKFEKPEYAHTVAATYQCIKKAILDYKDFINVFFLTNNLPASTAYIPNMIRRTVVLSDTDSTIFSVDEWVKWYFGDYRFTDEGFAVAGSIMYIATQCIAHCLAIFSANMGVSRSKIFKLAMKPEFVFPVFAQTSVAKHYYTCIAVKEGNVYKELEMEIKGVNLKNSASPKVLIKASHAHMKEVLFKIMDGEKISLYEELIRVAKIETEIEQALLSGNVEYFKHSKIKNAEAYARTEDESPYVHHKFWQEVFRPYYREMQEPPYGVIKIPTIIDNITMVNKWITNIQNKPLAARLAEWLSEHKKTSLPTIYLSTDYVRAFGIPEEIKSVIYLKKIILELTKQDRMILESLGYFAKSETLIRDQI